MSSRLATLAATVALAAVAAAAATADGAIVSLRVESASAPQPLFDGTVSTEPHQVDGGDGSGPHPCWGPHGAVPAPTATGALDDALRGAGIFWLGKWDPSFRDFFVDRIGPYASAPPDSYWSLTVNGRFSAGGCLATVADGDSIRFFYGPLFGAPPDDDSTRPGGSAAQGGRADSGPLAPPTARRGGLERISRRAAHFLRRAGGRASGSDWAELALALRSDRDPSGAARRLGDRLRMLPAVPRGDDVDSMALAAWALAMRGQHARSRRAAISVRSAQAADGGFPTMPGGDSNAQSTGVALIALRVAGLGARPTPAPDGPTPLDYLASLARRDGSIPYSRNSSPTPVWTTAQALLGLTSRAKLLAFSPARPSFSRRGWSQRRR